MSELNIMGEAYQERRKSGIALTGDVPWGTSFCHFYQSRDDQLDVVVPYFRAGLENNECCIWITPVSASQEDNKVLRRALPDFQECLARGQFQIVSPYRWYARGKKPGDEILSKLDEVMLRGFDGLRLAVSPNSKNMANTSRGGDEVDIIGQHNVIALYSYPRSRFDAAGLMEVVKKYPFALIRNADKLEVIESAEARIEKRALVRNEERLHSLFGHMAEGFAHHRIVLDERRKPCDYIFLEINDAFEKLVGLSAKDILGKRVTQVLPGIEKDPADWIGRYGRVALTGEPAQFESYSQPLKRWYSVSAFSTQKGFFTVIFTDITERKQVEESLRQRTAELEASNKELEAFSYSVSHDLRAPLRSMAGFSNALLEDYAERLDDQGKQYLKYVQESSELMARLIDDLLKLSRITRADMNYQKVSLSDLADKIVADLKRVEPDRKVAIQISPNVNAYGDQNLLRLVLENLLGNAWKFSCKSEPARIEMGVTERNGRRAYFVRDNGVGFDMTYADKLFKPFQRLHKASEFPGTGIGLATAQRIIRRHGGEVWAKSKIGEGAIFYFTLGQ